MEELHVARGGDIPAEVLAHVGVLQRMEALGVIPVQIQRPDNGGEEIIRIVALEREAQAALAVLVAGRHRL